MITAVRALVTGRVQQVGYRQACRQLARSLGLVGWVRNLPDGRVEWLAQGEAGGIDGLLAWSWQGPGGALVRGVESETVALDQRLNDFFIQPNPAKDR